MRRCIIASIILTTGCGFQYDVLDTQSVVEDKLIAETARFAGMKSVQVIGRITDSLTQAQKLQEPVGFYLSGVAWYYRPAVEKYVSLEPEYNHETATNVASHEVCHAVTGPQHDVKHWDCMASIATPTYPHP